jgi:hypothetical protein
MPPAPSRRKWVRPHQRVADWRICLRLVAQCYGIPGGRGVGSHIRELPRLSVPTHSESSQKLNGSLKLVIRTGREAFR